MVNGEPLRFTYARKYPKGIRVILSKPLTEYNIMYTFKVDFEYWIRPGKKELLVALSRDAKSDNME